MAELLLGFAAPTRGRVLVDDVDLALLDLSDWRRRVAYLPQRPRLFHGTLGNNIRLGRPDADPAAVRRALELAGAEPVVDRLPRGLDTIVGDRGEGLSGGEIRRVALARALVKDADLLVLDEPAAGLDTALAAHVARSVRSVANDRAVLVIAHDELSVRNVDAVMLLDGGGLTAVTGAVA